MADDWVPDQNGVEIFRLRDLAHEAFKKYEAAPYESPERRFHSNEYWNEANASKSCKTPTAALRSTNPYNSEQCTGDRLPTCGSLDESSNACERCIGFADESKKVRNEHFLHQFPYVGINTDERGSSGQRME